MRTPNSIIGFDFGLVHIGVAIGQTITGTARGVTTLKAKQGKPQWHQIDELLKQYAPDIVVVGLPLNMDDTRFDMTERATRFAKQIDQRYDVDVAMQDERLTSVEAKHALADANALGQAKTDHELAACFIVEDWMRRA